jgi:hypothetical protein
MAHRVALVFAMTLWLAGYSMPSLVTRRRRRVTYFAFPFGGRANGRVYRQCRQRPQRPREPCTVRLRRRQCYAHRPTASKHVREACGCRPPHARLTPAGCGVCGRRLPPRSRRHCLRGRACGAKRRGGGVRARGAVARAYRLDGLGASRRRRVGWLTVCVVCLSGSYFAGLPLARAADRTATLTEPRFAGLHQYTLAIHHHAEYG